MSLDDYLQGIDIMNRNEIVSSIRLYSEKEKVDLFNTYDFFDYVINCIEKRPMMKKIKRLNDETFSFMKDEFRDHIYSFSKTTYLEVDYDLFSQMLDEYSKVR